MTNRPARQGKWPDEVRDREVRRWDVKAFHSRNAIGELLSQIEQQKRRGDSERKSRLQWECMTSILSSRMQALNKENEKLRAELKQKKRADEEHKQKRRHLDFVNYLASICRARWATIETLKARNKYLRSRLRIIKRLNLENRRLHKQLAERGKP